MTYWQRLQHTVAETIQAGQIGTPVFVRATAVLHRGTDPATPDLTRLLGAFGTIVSSWFGSQPQRVYAVAPGRGHATLSIEFESGTSALIAVGSTEEENQIDLTLLGSQGAIYHTESIRPIRDGSLEFGANDPKLLAAIAHSLAIGASVRPGVWEEA